MPSSRILQKRQQPLYRSVSDHLGPAFSKSLLGGFQPRHSLHEITKSQDLVKSTELWGVQFGSGARRHIGRKEWHLVPSLSEARSQLRSLAWGSQIQIVQPSAAFHTRTRSEWRTKCWLPAGIVCCSLVSSTTEKVQSPSTPPSYVRLTLSHYQSSLHPGS